MNLNELSAEVAERQNISKYRAKKIINCVLDVITEQLMKDKYVYLQKLGKIYMRKIHWTFRKKIWFLTTEEKKGATTIPHIKISERLKRKCRWRYDNWNSK